MQLDAGSSSSPCGRDDPGQGAAASGPLAGLRVLDVSTMIAAPLAASILCDYGASVVKVEQPGTGDHVRRFGHQVKGHGLYWKALNRGKETVALDLRLPRVQAVVREWLPQFDILVENFRPGTLGRWGLGPRVIAEVAPRLIVLQVTAYGQTGPYRDRPGFGTLAEGMTGIVAASRQGDRPQLPPYPLADVMAGQLGAAAVLAAVHRRHVTGCGEYLDLAIYEAALRLVELDVLKAGLGSGAPADAGQVETTNAAAPRGTYRCSDGTWIALAASTQEVARRVLTAVGGDELAGDERFATNAGRLRHNDVLDALIQNWCAQRDQRSVIEQLSNSGCAVGPVETFTTMLDNPQVVARGSVVRASDPDVGSLAMAAVAPRFGNERTPVPQPAPGIVGRDTVQILSRDLGLSPDQVRALGDAQRRD